MAAIDIGDKANVIAKLETLLEDLKSYKENDRPKRLDLLRQAKVLTQDIEEPVESMTNRGYAETALSAALQTLVQWEVFFKIPKEGTITAKEVAAATGKSEQITTRMLRFVATEGILNNEGTDTYSHNSRSLIYTNQDNIDFFVLAYDLITPMYKIPAFIATHPKEEELFDAFNSIYNWSFGGPPNQHFYEFLTSNPEHGARFNKGMKAQENYTPIGGIYPFSEFERFPKDDGRVAVVDIGGGLGQALVQMISEAPSIKGRVVLQDTQPVLDQIPDEEIEGIQKMAMDYWDGQPVENAHIYYLRRIMHNHLDEQCIKVLKHVADAMAMDSRVLIAECIIPEAPTVGMDPLSYYMDMMMLTIAGRERSVKEFGELLERAGLELVKVWMLENQGVLEAKLKGT